MLQFLWFATCTKLRLFSRDRIHEICGDEAYCHESSKYHAKCTGFPDEMKVFLDSSIVLHEGILSHCKRAANQARFNRVDKDSGNTISRRYVRYERFICSQTRIRSAKGNNRK